MADLLRSASRRGTVTNKIRDTDQKCISKVQICMDLNTTNVPFNLSSYSTIITKKIIKTRRLNMYKLIDFAYVDVGYV